MQTYTVADGLVGPIIPVIYQDSQGTLWFGSDRGGISRFDGNTFVQYSGDPEVFRGSTINIIEDKWGHLWVLSKHPSEGEGIISRYNGLKFEFMTNGNCLSVDNDGDVWIGGNNTLTQYILLDSQVVPEPNQYNVAGVSVSKINVIYPSRDGTLWIGGNDAQGVLLMRLDADIGSWETANLERLGNLPDLPKDRTIFAITQDLEENLWFAGSNLLLRFDESKFEKIVSSTNSDTEQNNAIQSENNYGNQNVSVKSDSRGRIWYSNNQQVSWWDGKNLHRLKDYSRGTNQYNSLNGSFEIQDAWEKLWFATDTGAHAFESKNLNIDSLSLLQFDAALTGSTELIQNVYSVENGLGSDNIKTIFEAIDGKIWFGHDNGVSVFEPNPAILNHMTRTLLGSNSVRMIYSDESETLWFSIPGGVSKYSIGDEDLKPYPLTNVIVGEDSDKRNQRYNRKIEIIKIFEVEGDIWFLDKPLKHPDGFTLYRFFRYRNNKFDKISIRIQAEIGPGGETNYNDSDPLITSSNDPWIVLGGTLFLPSNNGLYRLSSDARVQFTPIESTETLTKPSNSIIALHSDSKNRLWCYYDSGEVKRFNNIRSRFKQLSGTIHSEVLPFQSLLPLQDSLNSNDVRWFYNSISGQLMFWENPDDGNSITELPGAASGLPLLSVHTSHSNSVQPENLNDVEVDVTKSITFAFKDGIKTYQGTELRNAVSIKLNEVRKALISTDGDLWLATSQGGIRYDGVTAETFTTAAGFLVDDMRDVHEDNWGNIWFATWGGGIVRYDGNTFQSITTKDGLVHNNVSDILESSEDHLWLATEGGATQYRPTLGALPFCNIVSVDTDSKTHTDQFMTETRRGSFFTIGTPLPARIKNLAINFQGISPLRDTVHYKFRLVGVDSNRWSIVSSNQQNFEKIKINNDVFVDFQPRIMGTEKADPKISYEGLKSGEYSFLISVFREGWPYTQRPAVLNFTIDQPIWIRWKKYLPTVIIMLALVSLGFRLIVNRRQTAQLRLEMREKEEAEIYRIRAELDEAQNMQMALLPTEPPETKSFDIAGMSIPATQVGGDFFDYLSLKNGQTVIAIADAAGKGIRGAMNAVLTNGMLHEVARYNSESDVILTDLNAGLSPRMYGPNFIALNLAILSESNNKVDYANGGQPYPILKRGLETIEIESSDLPLGCMKNVKYESETINFNVGDFLIFHSDGLIEALNDDEDMYDIDRFKTVVSRISPESTAEEVIQHIVDDVQEFVKEAEQYDDLTLVVVKRITSPE